MESGDWVNEFLAGLAPCTEVLSTGTATVMGHTVPAVLVRTVYGQELVFGKFNTERGKFKGKRVSQNATTEGVRYVCSNGHVVDWSPPFGDFE